MKRMATFGIINATDPLTNSVTIKEMNPPKVLLQVLDGEIARKHLSSQILSVKKKEEKSKTPAEIHNKGP